MIYLLRCPELQDGHDHGAVQRSHRLQHEKFPNLHRICPAVFGKHLQHGPKWIQCSSVGGVRPAETETLAEQTKLVPSAEKKTKTLRPSSFEILDTEHLGCDVGSNDWAVLLLTPALSGSSPFISIIICCIGRDYKKHTQRPEIAILKRYRIAIILCFHT